ncbi:uncharacterized protein L203_100291 [Cryptococcus depauperatus CBS 7841]|uniref:Uncharacterized protein n=1 Tax=Cryptococcus depauperatus CBS 7841 TaxID=1295531 RepID=A0A1E3IZ30_9TREE|nr:hypothetical protein L203_00050 [Cryptococcus depauperatus CBS 7841]
MVYLNTYTQPEAIVLSNDIHLNTPPEQYDLNYTFEVVQLKSDRVELRPFPSLHAKLYFEALRKYPEVLRWLGIKPFESLSDLLVWIERNMRLPIDSILYAIFTEPSSSSAKVDPADYVFAGVIAMINSSYPAMICEPGYITILPPFHRTHVQTHASGLIMHRILDHPSQGGLGLRRAQWLTTSLNTASQAASKRMGFKFEGVLRCQKILPVGKEGARDGRPGVRQAECPVRDDWYSSVTWYEWEEGIREHVDKLMAR